LFPLDRTAFIVNPSHFFRSCTFLGKTELPHGTFGQVYVAFDNTLQKQVAIKVSAEMIVDPDEGYVENLRDTDIAAAVRLKPLSCAEKAFVLPYGYLYLGKSQTMFFLITCVLPVYIISV